MIKELLHPDGPVFTFLDKVGQLILLSLLWLLGCVPLVTICTANASLYYAVVKSVRRGQGSAVKEFIRSYRATLSRGIPITIAAAGILAILTLNLRILQGQGRAPMAFGTVIGIAVTVCCLIYAGPVLSRFRLKAVEAVKLSFVMSLRYAHRTLVLILGALAVAAVQFYLLPMPAVLVLPGTVCLLSTFLIEKSLHAYMPEQDENNNAWYYET